MCANCHVVSVALEVRSPEALAAACARLQLAAPQHGEATYYDRSVHEGLVVNLDGWLYPVVFDTQSGQVHYDNFLGDWGKQSHLDQLLQAYGVERAKLEAQAQGHWPAKKRSKTARPGAADQHGHR